MKNIKNDYMVEFSFLMSKHPNLRLLTHKQHIEKGSYSSEDGGWIQYGFKTLKGAKNFAFRAKKKLGRRLRLIRVFKVRRHINYELVETVKSWMK